MDAPYARTGGSFSLVPLFQTGPTDGRRGIVHELVPAIFMAMAIYLPMEGP